MLTVSYRDRGDLIEQPPLLLQKGHVGIEHRLGQAEVEIGRRAGLAATRRPYDELAAQQVRLDLVSQGVDRNIHRGGQRLDTGWSPFEHTDQGLQVAPILLVQPLRINFLHQQGIPGDRQDDVAVGACNGKIADPAETGIGDPGGTATSAGELVSGRGVNGRPQLGRVDCDDAG